MSLTAEDLQAISDLMDRKFDEKLSPINQRLDEIENDITTLKSDVTEMKTDIEEVKEHAEITRETTNDIVEWIDTYWRDKDRPFPVDSKYVG